MFIEAYWQLSVTQNMNVFDVTSHSVDKFSVKLNSGRILQMTHLNSLMFFCFVYWNAQWES